MQHDAIVTNIGVKEASMALSKGKVIWVVHPSLVLL